MNKYKDEDANTPRPKVYNLKDTVRVIVSDTVLEQIKYLCNKIHRVEWSGVLFYSTKGDIHDIKNFTVVLEYIYLMDKGTGGRTDYMFSEELVGFRMDNAPEALTWKIGHIHSHHSMNAYFSPTDEDEMKLNSEHHNYYLSVIVNNRMDIVGRIGFRGEIQETIYSCKKGDGEAYMLNANTKQLTMFVYNAEITSNIDNYVGDTFRERFDVIKKRQQKADEKRKKEKEEKEKIREMTGSKFPPRKQLPPAPNGKTTEEFFKEEAMYNAGFDIVDEIIDEEFDETQFPSFFIMAGAIGSEELDLDDALEQLDAQLATEADELEYVTQLLNIATELFSRYFIGFPEFSIVDAFIDIFAELDGRSKMHSYIPSLLQGLEAYLMELKDVKEEVNGS